MSQSDDNAATDSSLPDDGVFSEPLRRVSFEPGMLLGIEATMVEGFAPDERVGAFKSNAVAPVVDLQVEHVRRDMSVHSCPPGR